MALVAVPVVTVTSTGPGELTAGEVAVMSTDETTMTPVAAAEPKLTPVAPVKLVPVMETEAPPAGKPADGLTVLTVGPVS